MNAQHFNAFQRLFQAGYRYIVPIAPPGSPVSRSVLDRKLGKIPGILQEDGLWCLLKGWQVAEPDEAMIDRWSAMGAGVGIRTGLQHDGTYIYALDADTKAQACADIVRAQIEGVFGDLPTRIGQAPKALYLVRCSSPIPYMSLGFDGGVFEILGQGKQFVAYGIHPGTGKPYDWTRGLCALDELTIHEPELITGLLDTLRARLPKAGDVYQEGSGRRDTSQQALIGDPQMLERAVPLIPNVYASPGREKFVRMAAAFRGAFQNDYERGQELFVEWAEKADLSSRPDDTVHEDPAQVYRSIKAPFGVGASWLYELAAAADPTGSFKKHEALAAPWFDAEVAAVQLEGGSGVCPLGPQPAGPDVFKMLSLGEIVSRPPLRFVIEGYLPERSVGFLYGEPGSRKSFIALDWALHLAFGKADWHGSAIDADPTACVVYIAGEGAHGFRTRALAWAKHHGIPEEEIDGGRFRLITDSVDMMSQAEVGKLARSIRLGVGRACFVVVDTVSRSIPGADENLQKEMSLFVRQCDVIRDVFECVVLGVHHANQRGTMRGSGVLNGAGDFVFKLTKGKASNVGDLFCEKQKDGPDAWTHSYRFDTVQVAGGSSLVPSGRVTSPQQVTVTAPDETARVLGAMDAAWKAREPWAKTERARNGRYAGDKMIREFGIPRETAKVMLAELTAAGMIAVEEYDRHLKLSGYRVLTYNPGSSAADNGIFG